MTNEYVRREDAVNAVEFGITLASAINIETGEWTELFQRENDELRKAVKRIEDIKPADVAPVVRCKDCKYRESDDFCVGRGFPYQLVAGDEFCSRAKTKEHIND